MVKIQFLFLASTPPQETNPFTLAHNKFAAEDKANELRNSAKKDSNKSDEFFYDPYEDHSGRFLKSIITSYLFI